MKFQNLDFQNLNFQNLARLGVAGIHTDAGKTHASAALCAFFGFEYFKIVQAGEPTDSEKVAQLLGLNSVSGLDSENCVKIHTPGIFLKTPASPHIAMKIENLNYKMQDIKIPESSHLLCESAGGLFTPLDSENCVIDFFALHKMPLVLVGRYYLGAINHILLSLHALKARGIETLALIMSQDFENSESKLIDEFILKHFENLKIAHLPYFQNLDDLGI